MGKTEKIAALYGVPMPETCNELKFFNETCFYWFKYNNVWRLYSKNSLNEYFLIAGGEAINPTKLICAPSLHQLINYIGKDEKHLLTEIGQYVYEQHDNIAEAVAQLIINNS